MNNSKALYMYHLVPSYAVHLLIILKQIACSVLELPGGSSVNNAISISTSVVVQVGFGDWEAVLCVNGDLMRDALRTLSKISVHSSVNRDIILA